MIGRSSSILRTSILASRVESASLFVKEKKKYPRLTLPHLLKRAARGSPATPAQIYAGGSISYAQLQEQVERCAAGLQSLGVKPGDRVALFLPNCPQFVIAYFGALRAGAIVTATSSMYTAREAGHQWHDAGVSVLIADRTLLRTAEAASPETPEIKHVIVTNSRDYSRANFPKLCRALRAQSKVRSFRGDVAVNRPGPRATHLAWTEMLLAARVPRPVKIDPGAVACLQYTGGTTGVSKGAMLTHANLVINALQSCAVLTGGDRTRHTFVAALPLFHIYAMTCVMISAIQLRARIIILPRFELKAALNVIKKYRPTIFHGVPTMYVAFNHAPNVRRYGLDSLRFCMSGGAPLPVEVREQFEALTGGRLVEGYGLTEASPVTHTNPLDGPIKSGSVGRPIPDTEARIVDVETGTRELPVGDVGEIIIRGPQVMKGYWNKPAETAEQIRHGWLHTGDIGRRDADGFFYIVDRKKDLIIAGGFNIYPREVEEVLFEHPKIKEAVVVGVADSYRGETVKAFIVLKDGEQAMADEITAFCRERLATYKVPRLVSFRDSLPKSGVGKYLRRELRNLKD